MNEVGIEGLTINLRYQLRKYNLVEVSLCADQLVCVGMTIGQHRALINDIDQLKDRQAYDAALAALGKKVLELEFKSSVQHPRTEDTFPA